MKKENKEMIENYYNFLRENNISWSSFGSFKTFKTFGERTEEETLLSKKQFDMENEIKEKIQFFSIQDKDPMIYSYMSIHDFIDLYRKLNENIFQIYCRIIERDFYTEENFLDILCKEYYINNDEDNYVGTLKGMLGFKIKKYEDKIFIFEKRLNNENKSKEYYCNLKGNINHLKKCRKHLMKDYDIVNHILSKYKLNRKLNKLPRKNKEGVRKI